MLKRFAIKTDSGDYYYIEDETHAFGHPTWFIFSGGQKHHILGLQAGEKGHQHNIVGDEIRDVTEFVDKVVKFSHKTSDVDLTWGPNVGQTTRVVEVILFS